MSGQMIVGAGLRYLLKPIPAPEFGPDISKLTPVLQQYWHMPLTLTQHKLMAEGKDPGIQGEWRDVPTVSA